ncbi:MAG: hypothetical protein J5590_00920 [Clostridia bacterium]|nr:hypothetical protein [Clostridia bacterium]
MQYTVGKRHFTSNAPGNVRILQREYENIYELAENTFVLHKNGKTGLCRIENSKAVHIADCLYDTVDVLGNAVFLSKEDAVRYYNSKTKAVRDFNEVIIDTPYMYGYGVKYQYIIHSESGKIIYKKKSNKYSRTYYTYCGETDKGPVFFDAKSNTYYYPGDNGYKPHEPHILRPIIINGKNIINITEGENGLGVIDWCGNAITENKYDDISLELNIKAVNSNESIVKTVKIY